MTSCRSGVLVRPRSLPLAGASSNVPLVKSTLRRAALFIALSALAGCAKKTETNTALSVVRITEDMGAPFSNLLVVGVGRDNERRRIYEYSMVDALTAKGARAETSYRLFPQSDIIPEQQMVSAVQDGEYDAVLMTRVIWVSEQMEYVPGTTRRIPSANWEVAGAPSRRFFAGAYVNSYELVHTPGYYKKKATYSVETMLFSMARNGMKVWSALSETVNPQSPETLIDEVTSVVARAMEDQGLIE